MFTALPFEGGVTGKCTEERRAQRVHVRRRRRRVALEHFWRRECGRTGDHPGRRLESSGDPGDAEVRQLRFAVVGQQDVARLDVTVQSAGAVGGVQRTRQLDADTERLDPIEGSVLPDEGFQGIFG